jgi:hypothetical protein
VYSPLCYLYEKVYLFASRYWISSKESLSSEVLWTSSSQMQPTMIFPLGLCKVGMRFLPLKTICPSKRAGKLASWIEGNVLLPFSTKRNTRSHSVCDFHPSRVRLQPHQTELAVPPSAVESHSSVLLGGLGSPTPPHSTSVAHIAGIANC